MITDEPDLVSTFGCFWENRTPATVRKLLPTVTNLAQERLEAEKESARIAELSVKLEELEQREEEQRLRADRLEAEKETEVKSLEGLRWQLDPFIGWCPVPLRQPIRICSVLSGKSMDFDYVNGDSLESHIFHLYDSIPDHANQKFEIIGGGPLGFAIRHPLSGQYISKGEQGPAGARMRMGQSPLAFKFEEVPNASGAVMIRLTHREDRLKTLNVEGGRPERGVKIIAWDGEKGVADQWRISPFENTP
uniref:Ricin B lectin domain-containing protein n=1 Tax=Mycena chlorophos TaxID=658473 RepID=A0ABQ0LZP1_MYCCL|nr:predicted protein [Mycena chlorophos]